METGQEMDVGAQPAEATPEQAEAAQRVAFIGAQCQMIRQAKEYWEKRDFKRMREDMTFARHGAPKEWIAAENYTANLCIRHLKNQVSSLYAKNPTAKAKRRDRLDFKVWDERGETLAAAMMSVQGAMTGMAPPSLQAMMIVQDVMEGQQRRTMLDKLGRTLEVLFAHFMCEPTPNFKRQMKALVRRTCETGVGYVKIGYQREMALSPDQETRLQDATAKLYELQRLQKELAEGDVDQSEGEAERLQQMIATIQAEPEMVVREGLVFAWPRSTAVIIDTACYQLDGFLGADWIAEEYLMPVRKVDRVYGVDLSMKQFKHYSRAGKEVAGADPAMDKRSSHGDYVRVWEVQNKLSGMVYTIADGYDDYLRAPAPPEVSVERFWTIYSLTFNDVESNDDGESDWDSIFPPSDIHLIKHAQMEHNRSRQALREHRDAATPFSVTQTGSMSEDDKKKVMQRVPFEVVEINNLAPNQDIRQMVQAWPTAPIDPNLYQTNPQFEDIQRSVGGGEPQFGSATGASATEAGIVEAALNKTTGSNIDDVDDFLTAIARDAGVVLLLNMQAQTVVQIAGPGAVWPSLSREEVVKEVYLEIEAGSSGKPNAAQELANLERTTPLLVQVPGINPTWLARKMVQTMDPAVDLTEAILEGAASITAMNAMSGPAGGAQPGTGDPATDPAQQGGKGASNAPKPGMPSGEMGGETNGTYPAA